MGTDATPPAGGPQIGSTGQTGGEADGRWPCAFLSVESGSRWERDRRRSLFLVPMSIVRPQLLEGGPPQDGGGQIQDEVWVTGLAPAATFIEPV